MPVTIEDVARLAGCSKTTVSRAFALPEKVKEETRGRIFRAAEQLHYSPNAIARAMVTQRNHNIAFIICEKHNPGTVNPFYTAVFEAVQKEADQLGYGVFIAFSSALGGGSSDLLMKKRVDGVIFAGQIEQAVLYRLREQNIPFVLVNNHLEGEQVVSITSNDYEGARQAVTHLIERGHTKIGLISGLLFPYISSIRYQAFLETMMYRGLTVNPSYIRTVKPTQEDAIVCVTELLSQPDHPTALFCTNDTIAIGAIKAAIRLGLRVPQDVAIVGYDGSTVCTVIEPELTSVAVDTAQMGRLGIQCLIREINGEPRQQTHYRLDARLVVRGSS